MSSERRAEKERRERENSAWRGAYGVVKGLIGYVLIPLVLMTYVFPMLPSDLVLDGIEDLLGRCMVGGIPLIAVAFLMGYYGKGHIGRVLAWVAFIVLKILWMLYVLDFGDLDGIFGMHSGDTLLTVDLAVSGIVTPPAQSVRGRRRPLLQQEADVRGRLPRRYG